MDIQNLKKSTRMRYKAECGGKPRCDNEIWGNF